MMIRAAEEGDEAAIWSILQPMLRDGSTYALPAEMTRESALAYWLGCDHRVFIAQECGEVLGTYYLRANQRGGGSHVANCGYVVAPRARGRGVARAMCLHSMQVARQAGFLAMQFNFVVSTNERAVKLWESLGFAVVGRVPQAFLHPRLGYVDALIMHRFL